jgi:peptide/nickel transport system ATP-binding protein
MKKLVETVDLVTNFYTYEGVVKALNRMALVLEEGATFGLVGESGCGKSVFARSIMRIVPEPGRIEGGKIILFLNEDAAGEGVNLLQQSEAYLEELRGDRISMIFQEPNAALNPTMSIGDQVAESYLIHRQSDLCEQVVEGLRVSGCGGLSPLFRFQIYLFQLAATTPDALLIRIFDHLPLLRRWRGRLKKAALGQVVDLLANLGISNPGQVVTQYPHHLSGGMKQRIVIAIALACHPLLLIADEATSNLDVTIQAQILELLRRLKKKEISSILLITHDLGVVAETCDRVGVMYAGNLCEIADVADLFQKPKHPYSRALLKAVPRADVQGMLKSIEGNVPNLVNPPAGCRFHPRCPHAMPVCSEAFPQMTEVGQNHRVACYLYTDQART